MSVSIQKRSTKAALVVALVLAAGAAVRSISLGSAARLPKPAVTVSAHLGQSAAEFFGQNQHIDRESQIYSTSWKEYFDDWGIVAFQANASDWDAPDGYILRYKLGACEVTLPAGRVVAFDYNAGFFNFLTSTLPMKLLTFEQMMALAREIAASFDKAGWKRVKYDPDIKQEGFGEFSVGGKFDFLGEWEPCNDARFYATIKLKDVNSLPTAPMVPLVPGRKRQDDGPDHYIIEVAFGDEVFRAEGEDLVDETRRLRDARRLAVNGDKNKPLRLKDWVDDPNWRPEGWQGRYIK